MDALPLSPTSSIRWYGRRMPSPSSYAAAQYGDSTGRLDARIAIHRHGTNPVSWFDWLASRLPTGGDVLEVGAGTGELWRHVEPSAYASVTLTDFSAAMCDRLAEVPGTRVEQCDAASLPFGDGSFDVVIANHMLYHVDDPGMALAEFARALRPGGRLAVATNGADHLADLAAVGAAVGRPDLAPGVTRLTFVAENGPALVARFFSAVRVERYPCDLEVPAVEPVMAYVDSLSGEPLTSGQRAAAMAYVAGRIAEDGCFRVRKHTVLVTAVR
jgi:SAM-dependent methyltransferase